MLMHGVLLSAGHIGTSSGEFWVGGAYVDRRSGTGLDSQRLRTIRLGGLPDRLLAGLGGLPEIRRAVLVGQRYGGGPVAQFAEARWLKACAGLVVASSFLFELLI